MKQKFHHKPLYLQVELPVVQDQKDDFFTDIKRAYIVVVHNTSTIFHEIHVLLIILGQCN